MTIHDSTFDSNKVTGFGSVSAVALIILAVKDKMTFGELSSNWGVVHLCFKVGGAIYISSGSLIISDTTFKINSAVSE